MLHRIAVISDTHSLLRPEVRSELEQCEYIFHAGDIASGKITEELKGIAPLYVVRGNADKEWAEDIPAELDTELYGFRIYMVHNKKHMRADLTGVDLAIYGHSHKYEEKRSGKMFLFNPGSCGPRRFHQAITMGVLYLDDEAHTFRIERIDIAHPAAAKTESGSDVSAQDMSMIIRRVIRDMKSGKHVNAIAEKHKIPVDLVNQILQIYTTHPGVYTEGILNRMDIWGK